MNSTLLALVLGIGLPAIIGLGVGMFAKFFPKEETFKSRIAPISEMCAGAVFFFMGRWLKPSEIDKIEEGLFKTLAYWLDGFIAVFMAKLDNLITEATKK
jgi:hypothetical protein